MEIHTNIFIAEIETWKWFNFSPKVMVSTVVTDDEVKWGQKGIFSINSKNVSKVGRNFKSNLIFHFQFSSYSHVQLHSTPSVSNWSDFNLQQTLRCSFHAVVIRSLDDIIDKKKFHRNHWKRHWLWVTAGESRGKKSINQIAKKWIENTHKLC